MSIKGCNTRGDDLINILDRTHIRYVFIGDVLETVGRIPTPASYTQPLSVQKKKSENETAKANTPFLALEEKSSRQTGHSRLFNIWKFSFVCFLRSEAFLTRSGFSFYFFFWYIFFCVNMFWFVWRSRSIVARPQIEYFHTSKEPGFLIASFKWGASKAPSHTSQCPKWSIAVFAFLLVILFNT